MTDPSRAKKPATYEDLVAVPDHLVAEIVDGELVTSPRPASPHAFAASALGAEIFGTFGRGPGNGAPGGWWILYEPEVHLGTDVLVPDLVGWRRQRMPKLPNVPFFKLAPDWVCEVVSPSTVRNDRVRKMRIYAREGISNLWLVDPLARTLEVYGLEAGRWIVRANHAGDAQVRAEPFEAFELSLSGWWIEL